MFILHMSPNIIHLIVLIIAMITLVKHLRSWMMWILTCFTWECSRKLSLSKWAERKGLIFEPSSGRNVVWTNVVKTVGVLNVCRKLPLKLDQKQFSNNWHIDDIKFQTLDFTQKNVNQPMQMTNWWFLIYYMQFTPCQITTKCGDCGVYIKSPHFVVIWQGINCM